MARALEGEKQREGMKKKGVVYFGDFASTAPYFVPPPPRHTRANLAPRPPSLPSLPFALPRVIYSSSKPARAEINAEGGDPGNGVSAAAAARLAVTGEGSTINLAKMRRIQ